MRQPEVGIYKRILGLFRNSALKIIEGVGHNIISSESAKYFEQISVFLNES